MDLVTEKVISDYFDKMAGYGDKLEKSLETVRNTCKEAIKKNWEEVKTNCDNYSQKIETAYLDSMEAGVENGSACAIKDIETLINEFRATLDKYEKNILDCIEQSNNTALGLDDCKKSKDECTKELKEITETIEKCNPRAEIPEIRIGNKRCHFNELLLQAEGELLSNNNNSMFLNFANKSVVDIAIGAFVKAGIF